MFLFILLVFTAAAASIIFFIISLFTKKYIFAKLGCGIIIAPFALVMLLSFISFCFFEKMEVTKDDIYGEYVINQNKCAGEQADWQFEHYRFKITEDNKMHFYLLQNGQIVKTITKPIEIRDSYTSARIDIKPNEEDFHIIRQNPTLYREVWSFYYVFESDKYGNMFFTKKKWW